MPRYDYICPVCKAVFDRVAAHDEIQDCSECGNEADRQFPTNQHLRFGADPYEKDFREMEANGELNG